MQNPEPHHNLLKQVFTVHIEFRKHCPWEYSGEQKMFAKCLQNWY